MKGQIGSVCIGIYLSRRGLAFVAAAGPIDDPAVLASSLAALRANPFATARGLEPEAARNYLNDAERDVLSRVRTAFDEFMSSITEPGLTVIAAAVPRPIRPARASLIQVLRSERLMRRAEERLLLRACRTAVKAIALPWIEYDRSQVFSAAAEQAGLAERDFIALVRSLRTHTTGAWNHDLQAACTAALLAGTCARRSTTRGLDSFSAQTSYAKRVET